MSKVGKNLKRLTQNIKGRKIKQKLASDLPIKQLPKMKVKRIPVLAYFDTSMILIEIIVELSGSSGYIFDVISSFLEIFPFVGTTSFSYPVFLRYRYEAIKILKTQVISDFLCCCLGRNFFLDFPY